MTMTRRRRLLRLMLLWLCPLAAGGWGCSAPRSSAPVVAVLTDYGNRDAYVGVLYGAILSRCAGARLVPITHQVPDFDIASGSFILGMASEAFPEGTIFCTVVDPGVGTSRRSIVLRTKQGKVFVGPDNGTFTDVIRNQGLDGVWEIDEEAIAVGEWL